LPNPFLVTSSIAFTFGTPFALLGKIIVVVTNGAFLLIVVATIMRGVMQICAFLITTTIKRNAKIILYQELLIELMIKLHTFTWYYVHVQLFCK